MKEEDRKKREGVRGGKEEEKKKGEKKGKRIREKVRGDKGSDNRVIEMTRVEA
jgi:hypothetical protein